jgi:hypothetical protein
VLLDELHVEGVKFKELLWSFIPAKALRNLILQLTFKVAGPMPGQYHKTW